MPGVRVRIRVVHIESFAGEGVIIRVLAEVKHPGSDWVPFREPNASGVRDIGLEGIYALEINDTLELKIGVPDA